MQSESTNNSCAGQGNTNQGAASNNNNNNGDGQMNGASPAQSPQSADSNSNAPTSSLSSMLPALVQSNRHSLLAASDSNASITPSISLIPIKQVRTVTHVYVDLAGTWVGSSSSITCRHLRKP